MNPYQALANAIVELAVKDYKAALKQHYRFPDNDAFAGEAKSQERFFRSSWFEMLTDLDGERLLSGVRALVRKEVAA